MSINQAEGIQHISNLVIASEIKNEVEYNKFCQEQLDEAENMIKLYKDFISLDTFMFHPFFLLEYRIQDGMMPLSDLTIEKTFLFLCKIIPYYKSSFLQNEHFCFTKIYLLYNLYLFL